MIKLIIGAVITASLVGGFFSFFDKIWQKASNPKSPANITIQQPELIRINEPPIPTPPQIEQNKKPISKVTKVERLTPPPQATLLEVPCQNEMVNKLGCLKILLEKMVKENNTASAMLFIKDRYDKDPYVKSMCHQLTHIVGRTTVNYFPTAEEAFRVGDAFCWSGYYHGAMEAISLNMGEINLAKNIDYICAKIPGKDLFSFDYYNCVHGLGHGAMAIKRNELFESLKFCDNLSGEWEKASCWGGAFMENIIADELNHFSKYLKPDDPLYPCNVVEDTYKSTCYLMQTSYMLRVMGQDFSRVFDLCSQVGEMHKNTCYQSLGRDASGHTNSDVMLTRAHCLLGKNYEQQSNCVIGAVKDFISYFHSDKQAKAFCASLSQELQSPCFNTAEYYYKFF